MSHHPTERLFFALWPNSTIRQAINEQSHPVIQEINGKIVPYENWHITLAFLGAVDQSAKECMQQVAETIQSHPFTLSLDQLGYWSNSRILWLGASQTPEALMELENSLNTNLQRCGYRPEKRPFRVHLTLMRKASPVKTFPPITPIIWTVEDFCLVRSTIQPSGANYKVIARW